MKRALLLVLVLLAGCGTVPQTEQSLVPPEIVSLSPLPPFRSAFFRPNLRLEVLLYVTKDGTVDDAALIGTSGDSDWDSLALKAVRQWRFTSPKRDGEPTDLWIRQQVTVQFQEPVLMALAEIACSTQQQADSLFVILDTGADFGSIARQVGGSPSSANGGGLGTVDISLYPASIRSALSTLVVGEMTKPLKLGTKYVIFKRVRKEAS